MKNSRKCLAVLFLASLAAACGGSDNAPNPQAPSLVSIAVTPADPVMTTGATQQFTATGTYSDSTSTVLTTAVTWSTSNATVSTISNSAGTEGLATAGATGSSTISALYNGVTGTASLTVAAPALLTITPAPPVSFFDTTVGLTSSLTFTVTNSGGAPSGSITMSLSETVPTTFSITSDGCTGTQLAGGASCTVQVTFAPVEIGSWSVTLSATATPGGTASTYPYGET